MFWKIIFGINSFFFTCCGISVVLGWVPPLSLAENAAFFGAGIACFLYAVHLGNAK